LSPAVSENNQGESFASGLLDALIALPLGNIQPNYLDPLLQRVLETVLHFTGFECGALYIYLGEDAGFNLGSVVCMVENTPQPVGAVPFTRSDLLGQAIQLHQAIFISNSHVQPETAVVPHEAGYNSRLCLPILFNNVPQGVIDLIHRQKRCLSPYQISQLEPAIDAIAQIIAAALLEMRIQTANDWLNRLNVFGNRILGASTYRQALDLTLRNILETTQAYSASAFLFDNSTLTLGLAVDSRFQQICDETMSHPDRLAYRVLQTGKPVVVSGYEPDAWKDLGLHLEQQGIKAYVGLALKCGEDAPLGVLFVHYQAPHLFLPDEIHVLNLYAAQASGAIEHLRLLEESRRRESDLANMVDTVHLLITTLDVDELLNQITIRMAWMTGMDSCAISVYNKDQRYVYMLAQYNTLGELIDEYQDFPFYLEDYPLTERVLETNQPCLVRVDDPAADPAEVSLLQKMNYRAVLMLPLVAGNEPFGLVELYSNKSDVALTPDNLNRLIALSEQVTLALINARHYQDEQRARLAAETLRQATAALNSTLELNQVLDLILEQVRRMIEYDSASLMLLQGKSFHRVAVRGQPYMEEALEARIPLEESGLAESLVVSKDWIIVPDAQVDERFKQYGQNDHIRSWLGLPLVSRGEVIGVLTVESRRPGVYSHQDAVIAMTFADQAVLAVENARLFESERDNRAMAEALGEISLALSSSLKASATLEILLEQIERVIPFDSAAVLLLEGNQVHIASQRGFERFGAADIMEKFSLDLEQMPNLQYMAYTLCSHCVADVDNFPGWVTTDTSRHIKSWVGAPLVAREHLLGFLSLDKVERGYYTREHARRLEVLARHAALALLNALNYGEVEQASITDYLTGAYNHRYFQQQLRVEWERASRASHPLSLLIIDIDHFKNVNDAHGHLTGDQVLRVITTRMKGELRTSDQLARYGGEEFAVILPNTPTQGAENVGERLKRSVSSFPIWVENLTIDITVSVGVATFPDQAATAQDLIGLADKAMYQAKAHGRNCIYVAGSEKEKTE
jgi:diguanylate cyclase (GGDEF)-like protein